MSAFPCMAHTCNAVSHSGGKFTGHRFLVATKYEASRGELAKVY